jgi:small subunit ribosomal protein S17
MKSNEKKLIGTVISDSMEKTRVVAISTKKIHPLYGKKYPQTTKIKAHDETHQAKNGDLVEITEIKPKSRHKAWEITKVIQ